MKLYLPLVAATTALVAAETTNWNALAEAKVAAMSVDEWIGQMTQINLSYIMNADGSLNEAKVRECARLRVGSFLNGSMDVAAWRKMLNRIQAIFKEEGAPPVLYGLDSIHGASYSKGAALSPQQTNKGASFNRELVKKSAYITARDSAASGINWIFAPNGDVVVHKRWSRIFESYGEDPYLVSEMIGEAVTGIQSVPGVAANFKHFIAYGATSTGDDRGRAYPSEYEILNYYSPPFVSAINAGALSGMSSYVVVNDVPMVANKKLTVDLLRRDMGFDGLLVTDWQDIYNLLGHGVGVKTRQEAIALSLGQASIDMSMVPDDPDFIQFSKNLLSAGTLKAERFREGAKRVVKMKLQLGMYETPVPGAHLVSQVGSDADHAESLALARESIVLLKNKDNILPVSGRPKLFLTGPSIDNIGYLCGAWTWAWQGVSGNAEFPKGKSILKGFQDIYGADAGSKIKMLQGVNIDGVATDDLAAAKAQAAQAEYTIIAVGEKPATEMDGNIKDATLPAGQLQYIREIASTGTKVILVLVEARPRILNGVADVVHAVIDAMLPCEAGGQAIAEIITGAVNPSGRLTITYPKTASYDDMTTPYFQRKSGVCTGSKQCAAEWDFGAGLSYTTFAYSNFTLSAAQVTGTNALTATVTVTNSGNRQGKEAVLLFVSQQARQSQPVETKLLKKFTKIDLAPGASQTVSFSLSVADWGIFAGPIGSGLAKTAEAGTYYVAFKPETVCDASHLGPLCQAFTYGDPITPLPTTLPPSPADVSFTLTTKLGKIVTTNMWNIVVQTPAATPAPSQQLVYNTATKQIRDRALGRCFDVYADASAPIGYRLHMYACDAANSNQKWTLNYSGNQVAHATFTNVCLDADPTDAGGNVQVWWCNPAGTNPNQFFTITTGATRITSVLNGRAFTVESTAAHAGVTFSTLPSALPNWRFDAANNLVRVDGSTQCLDAWQPQNGGGLHVWDCDVNNSNQKWQFDTATGQLRHLSHKGFCLDMQSDSGATPHLWSCHPTSEYWYKYQQFSIQSV
ncbi:glycoside hydrolase [Achlya hypogyna]|uniref:beta-glucosidase n=1 Tax=Achlya hypogyna TaxID=1202772 RepID=A0A0A7CNB0_ACHHY|nr:secreted protein [Achlya hypogyna]OQR92659.1 glycoside hydrolase [Achlya hypogyna]